MNGHDQSILLARWHSESEDGTVEMRIEYDEGEGYAPHIVVEDEAGRRSEDYAEHFAYDTAVQLAIFFAAKYCATDAIRRL